MVQNVSFFFLSQESGQRKHFRSGGTMSLSENEMDSDDMDMPTPLKLKSKDDSFLKKPQSNPNSNNTTPKREFL